MVFMSASEHAKQIRHFFDEVIDVRVVNLEVVVTDRSGNRVTGLGPEDFELFVDRRAQDIQYFSEVRASSRSWGF